MHFLGSFFLPALLAVPEDDAGRDEEDEEGKQPDKDAHRLDLGLLDIRMLCKAKNGTRPRYDSWF